MTRRQLEMDLQDLFEGRLEGEAFENLQEELRRNPDARKTYREYLLLEHSLKFRSKGVDLLHVVPMDRVNARQQKRILKIAGMSAAALVAVAAVILALVFARTPPPTLVFAASPGSDLMISHQIAGEKPPQGQVLEPGSRLLLESGTVELRFASGVRGVIRGPADLTLKREDLLELGKGTGWFDVPPAAVGFQVVTPDLVLTDLGTEFGIVSKPDFLDEVHVFEGKVEVLNRHGLKRTETLAARNARAAGPAGHWNDIPLRSDPFFTELPATARAMITLDDSADFTSSPENQMLRKATFRFEAKKDLVGFDCGKSDKLIVTLSHERGSVANVAYGGINLVRATEVLIKGSQGTSIFFLDDPPAEGDLVVDFNGASNGVGGSLLALSNTAPGAPVATASAKTASVSLSTPVDNCFLVVSHACNSGHQADYAKANSPMNPLFGGPTGSSLGACGYRRIASAGKSGISFSGTGLNPVTAAAAFAPIP